MTSVADKVIDQNLGVFTDLSVVDGTSTTGQEKKTIETLEQHGTGLMDSAKNSLAVLLQLVQKIENSPRCLRVQSRGWFVQEEKKSGLCS